MVSSFECDSMRGEEMEFTVRVEYYSMRALKGYIESSEYVSPSGNTKWSIVVYSSDRADDANYIDVRLKLKECSSDNGQFVRANVAIEGPFGLLFETNEKDLFFRGTGDADAVVFSLTKGNISNYFGLKRYLLLPDDTLTLVCKLVILKESTKSFKTRADFEGSVEKRERDESRRNKIFSRILKYIFVLFLFVAACRSIISFILTYKAAVMNNIICILYDNLIPFMNNFVAAFIPIVFAIILLSLSCCLLIWSFWEFCKNDYYNTVKNKPRATNGCLVSGTQEYSRYQQNDNNYPRGGMRLCAEETTRKLYLPQNPTSGEFGRRRNY